MALGLAAASLWNADPVAALEQASRAIEIGREQASDAVWATGTAFGAWALSMMGLFDRSTRKYDQAWETADRLDNVLTAFAAAWAKCHGYERDYIEHSNLAVMEFEKPRQAQTIKTRETLRLTAAGALVWAGQVPRAREMLQGAMDSMDTGGPGVRYLTDSFAKSERLSTDAIAERDARGMRWTSLGALVYALGPVQWANGNIAGARESFERAVTLCERGCIVEEFEARARLACPEALDGEATKAAEHVTRLDALQELGDDWRGFLGTADLARALTIFATETADADAAEPLFVKAIDNYREFGLPFGEAEALFMWGRALAGSDPGRATEKFSASLDLFKKYEAGKAWVDLVTAELDRLR